MTTTAGRLLALLALLQVPRPWSGPVLAERLAVSTRTVRKDVERLRELGYPVASVPGPAGGYRLQPGTELPPLLLDDDEAVAVVLGLQAGAVGSTDGAGEISLSALAKVSALLPGRLRRRVETMTGASTVLPGRDPLVAADVLLTLAAACRAREGVRFSYVDGNGEESSRDVEPYQLVHRAGRWYLVGFDLGRSSWRSYRVDRLRLRVPGGPRFSPRPVPGGDPARLLVDRIDVLSHRCRATVLLHSSAADLASWWQPAWGAVEAVDGDHCRFEAAGDSYAAIAAGLLLSGLEFEVLDPPELHEEVRQAGARAARAVDRWRPPAGEQT